MADAIEFFFDFSSPYGYLASRRIDAIAERHGRQVAWRPMMLGPALAATGGKPLVHLPLKGDYARRDLARTARLWDIPFKLPSRFPLVTLAAARACYWLEATAPGLVPPFATAVFGAYFAQDRDITDRAVLRNLLTTVGADAGQGLQAITEQAIKDRLRTATDEAVGRGVFGSPFVFVDAEPFWGADRLDQVDRWLERGGC
jgi:2-hydroxychromene-2-carboxylate isomerase